MSPTLYGEDTLVSQTTGGVSVEKCRRLVWRRPGPVPAPTGGGELSMPHNRMVDEIVAVTTTTRCRSPTAPTSRRAESEGDRIRVGARSSGTKWRDPEDLAEESWCVWGSAARGGDLIRMLDFVAAVWPRRLTSETGKPSGLPTHGVTHGEVCTFMRRAYTLMHANHA